MVQSSASAITLVVAAISIASSMALPFEQRADNLGVIKRIFNRHPDVRAMTSSEPQNTQSTMDSGAHSSSLSVHSSGPGAHFSSPITQSSGSGMHPSGTSIPPSGLGPEITSTPHISGSPGGTKIQHGLPSQTTTIHHTITSASHCHGKNGTTMSGGGGYENHSKTPHPSSHHGVPSPSGSAKPSIPPTESKPPMGRRVVTPPSSMPSGRSNSEHSTKSSAPGAQSSATHQSGGQEPPMTVTDGQTSTLISKHGTKPTGCPMPSDKPGSQGGHGGGDDDDSGHGKGGGHKHGNGNHMGSQESNSSNPTPTQGGTNNAKATQTQGGYGATGSGKPDPAQTKGQNKRSIFQREPSLDELD